MDYIQKLTEYFRKFPGIGEKQASRFVYFLLRTNPAFAQELSEMILKIRENIHQCESCFIFFSSDQSVKKIVTIVLTQQQTKRLYSWLKKMLILTQ